MRGNVEGRLPVISVSQFLILLQAYEDSFSGLLWGRNWWTQELGGNSL